VQTAEGSSAIVNAVYLPMAFISGAFFSPREMPRFLEVVSEALPLTYLLRLIRSTFIEGETLNASPGAITAVLVWGFLGLVVAMRMFRWEPREGMSGA
jgi:ABC-2 type transport system permease protein